MPPVTASWIAVKPATLQVLPDELAQVLQIVTPEQRARAVAVRQCVGSHDVGEVGVRVRRVVRRPRRATSFKRERQTLSRRLIRKALSHMSGALTASSPARGRQKSSDVTGKTPYGCLPQRNGGNGPPLRT